MLVTLDTLDTPPACVYYVSNRDLTSAFGLSINIINLSVPIFLQAVVLYRQTDDGAQEIARQYAAGGGEIYLLKKRLAEIAEEGRKKKNLRTKTPSSTSPTTPHRQSLSTPNISKDQYEKGILDDGGYAL